MKYSLDSNIVIALLNNHADMMQKIRQYHVNDFVISSIVMFELYFGAQKSQRTAKNLLKLQKLAFPILHFTENDANIAGELNQQGTPIGAYDVLIAGQAINNNLVLVSHNVKEFARIPELTLEDWLYEESKFS